jgi:hypothetical protein
MSQFTGVTDSATQWIGSVADAHKMALPVVL